jgi:hypothetical protein
MTAFDLAEVRTFTADLDARLARCDNGEGVECANLDGTLQHYAKLCCEFCEAVRAWGRAIFAGRAAFDPEVERLWLQEGYRLHSRALGWHAYGQKAQEPCYILYGEAVLRSAVWDLHHLLTSWVTPKLAVGPAARHLPLESEAAAEAQHRIDALPHRKMQRQRTS